MTTEKTTKTNKEEERDRRRNRMSRQIARDAELSLVERRARYAVKTLDGRFVPNRASIEVQQAMADILDEMEETRMELEQKNLAPVARRTVERLAMSDPSTDNPRLLAIRQGRTPLDPLDMAREVDDAEHGPCVDPGGHYLTGHHPSTREAGSVAREARIDDWLMGKKETRS
jgi:hypothetical protein